MNDSETRHLIDDLKGKLPLVERELMVHFSSTEALDRLLAEMTKNVKTADQRRPKASRFSVDQLEQEISRRQIR